MSLNNNNQPRVKKDRKNSQQVFREDNSARITFQEQTVNPGLLGFDTENSTPQTLEFPTSGNNNSVQRKDEILPENVKEDGLDFLFNSMYDDETNDSGRDVEGGAQATSFSEITKQMIRMQQRQSVELSPEESLINARSVTAETTVNIPAKGICNKSHLNAKDLNTKIAQHASNDYNGLLNHVKQYAGRLNSSQHQRGLDA